jgi:arabinogalactan oligomer/maltooligosaccharide transport system permease protein
MSVMVSLPVAIVYLALQRYIVGGLTLGGVKG